MLYLSTCLCVIGNISILYTLQYTFNVFRYNNLYTIIYTNNAKFNTSIL